MKKGTGKSVNELLRKVYALDDASSNAHINIGEGETKDGNRTMLTQDLNCKIL